MTSFLFLLCLFSCSSCFYESAGKERKGEAGKRPPQSSGNSPGIHDKTRERRACRSPPPLLSFATSRQTKRQGGRAHKRRPICACLPSALSFLPFPTVVREEAAKRRDEERRGTKKDLEKGAEPSPSLISPFLSFLPLSLSFSHSLSSSLPLPVPRSHSPLLLPPPHAFSH